MVSIALESLVASPLNNACSVVSVFTIGSFNTGRGAKVTQNRAKIIFSKIVEWPGYLFSPSGINFKFTHTKSLQNMKKVFAILAVAGVMAACNSGEDKAKAAADSARIADSTSAAIAADSAAKAVADTSKAAMDTTKKM